MKVLLFFLNSATTDGNDVEIEPLKPQQKQNPGSKNDNTSELYLNTSIPSTQNTFCGNMSKCNSTEVDRNFDKAGFTADKKVTGNVNITINQLNETSQQRPLQPNGKISLA